ncbi:MAG: hypothetical protein RJB68_2169 [Pseudomonadota bacterium]|jgi:hypothetical protein
MSKLSPTHRKLAEAKEARRKDAKARRRAAREFNSQTLDLRIKLFAQDDGADATELLACLSVVIGTPCEAGARQFGHESVWVRRLHGALRTVLWMCTDNGYRWDAKYAPALDVAVAEAMKERPELEVQGFTEAWHEANHLSTQILNHTVQRDAIAA